jgi:penicillin-binding protein 1B
MSASRRRGRRAALWVFLVALAIPTLYGVWLYAALTLPRGEDRQPLKIYSAPYPLVAGMRIDKPALQNRLSRLGYRQVFRKQLAAGEYRLNETSVDVHLREFLYADALVRAQQVRLTLEDGQIARIAALPDEQDTGPVTLEPQLIGGVLEASRQVREWVPLSGIPASMIDAVLAIEDRRFYRHVGIDPVGIARATWENLKGGAVVQGGSTITQQLAKNLYYTQHRTFVRKLKEAFAALILEMKYSKDDILESYLNEIYLGQSGSVAVYGVQEGAHYYFGKPLSQLSAAEAALLAGMIKGPNTYAPVRDAKRAKQRRDLVLFRLKLDGKLSDKQYQAAVGTVIKTGTQQRGLTDAPYFLDYILAHIADLPEGEPQSGLRVFTTLDLEMQRLAEQALSAGVARLEAKHRFLRTTGDHLQAALIALDPKSGAILAMVGGRDYRSSQFNHAVQARRQPGSLFKPFVYATAFQRSLSVKEVAVTPATLIDDSPISFPDGEKTWEPQNYDRRFHGQVTVRSALEQSLNIPVVRVAQVVGVHDVIATLRAVGIHGPLDEHVSLALGTSEVSLLEITGAYGAFANSGRYVPPKGLAALVEQVGEQSEPIVSRDEGQGAQAFSPEAAYVVTSILQGVIERGTAAQARGLGLIGDLAGKTGTTDEHRDAWFVGYTPDIVVGVWVGFDEGTSLKLTGAQAALPIWVEFFRKAVPFPSPTFRAPTGIVIRTIDPQTGQLATSACPQTIEETFVEGTEPTIFCEVHSPGMLERLKNMFGL